MRESRAFALRDLVAILCLVVLALPVVEASLRGPNHKAYLARCRANLRALMHGVHLYAHDNGGYMPVYRHTATSGYPDAPPQPDRTTVAFAGGVRDPDTGLYEDVRDLGHLYVQKYVRRPEFFYCPAQPEVRHTLEFYPEPWGSQVGPGSMLIRTGYMWNPWVKQIPEGAADQWTYEDGLALRMHPFHRPLICDLVYGRHWVAHVTGKSAIWNMAYPAGHVRAFASKKLYDKFLSPEGPGLDAAYSWVTFNAEVRPLLPGANAKWWNWMKRWRHRLR